LSPIDSHILAAGNPQPPFKVRRTEQPWGGDGAGAGHGGEKVFLLAPGGRGADARVDLGADVGEFGSCFFGLGLLTFSGLDCGLGEKVLDWRPRRDVIFPPIRKLGGHPRKKFRWYNYWYIFFTKLYY
jgi:hypothetical protein